MHKARLALGFAVVLLASTLTAATPDAAPVLTLQLQATKAFQFSWTSEPGSTHYRLLEDPTGSSGFTQIGPNIAATSTSFEHIVPLYRRVNARYIVQACDAVGCVDSNTVHASAPLTEAIGYFKASNVGWGDEFGTAVALSSNGTTLAVGAPREDSAATGIGGDQLDDSAGWAGAVYVFVREGSGSAWTQQAYIKASNTEREDEFGHALALSADGSTLAVGAPEENSGATGVNGNQSDSSAQLSGAVYVFERAGSVWTQQAYIKASNTGVGDLFGSPVSLSGDGRTLAVAASCEQSGVPGHPFDNSAECAGAVYVYGRVGSSWAQQVYLKAPNPERRDHFGHAMDLSNDGSTLAVGAPWEDSSATGVNGNRADNNARSSGAVYVFVNLGAVWALHAYIKASNTGADDRFGIAVALSGNGSVLAVGADGEDSSVVGHGGGLCQDGSCTNNLAPQAGAVYVFGRAGSTWTQQVYIKASNIGAGDQFGRAVAISNDGATLAVGAPGEGSTAVGINGDETSEGVVRSGAAYVFAKNNGMWTQRAYVKASNKALLFGASLNGSALALAGNGGTLAVGSAFESGSSSGINGPQVTPVLLYAGAVYVY